MSATRATRWNDEAERRALRAGSYALRLRADDIASRSGDAEGAGGVVKALRHDAEVLEEMADCYAVKP